jgi:hypothetical protein
MAGFNESRSLCLDDVFELEDDFEEAMDQNWEDATQQFNSLI